MQDSLSSPRAARRHAFRLHGSPHHRAAPAGQVQDRDDPRLRYISSLPRESTGAIYTDNACAVGDRVLVGLNSGALRVYRLNELPAQDGSPTANADVPSNTPPQNGQESTGRPSERPTDLLREVERFSTRAIEQLAIIKEANTIVSLSNYHVSLHDLQTYELTETLERTKNASCFAVTSNIVKDPDTGIPEIISRLAVAVKKRILLWDWHESEPGDDVTEIVLYETIRSMTWASATKLVCGMNGGYVMVDVLNHKLEDIVSPGAVGTNGQGSRFGAVSSAGMGYMGLGGYTPKPLAAKLADGEMLLAKDINTLFIDDLGKPIEKKQIPWQSAPESIGYSYPYILALQPPSKGSLEIRNPDTLSLLQTIGLPGAAQLHFPPPTVSLAHAGKGFHISSERCVWKMDATNYDSQIEELVANGMFDEAISLLGLLEDALLRNKAETVREVKMLKAEKLFTMKKFEKSMDLFNEDDVHASPERVLKLFPPEISGELSGWVNGQEKDSNEAEEPTTKPNGSKPGSPEAAANVASPPKAGGFAKYLMGGHRKTQADTASIASSKPETVDAEDADSVKEQGKAETGPLEGKDLMNAVRALNSYLAGTRARLQRLIDPATGKLKPRAKNHGTSDIAPEQFLRITKNESEQKLEDDLKETFRLIDTTLFRSYMFSQPALAGSLFRLPNFCDPDVVNEKLLEHSRYTELVDFFWGKKLHKEALELLRRFGTATKPDPAAPTLHGPDRAIQYLQGLPPSEIDLILEHAQWTLDANPGYAMEIFIGDTENSENLPRDQVLSFLRKQGPKLEAQYLQHIINELGDVTQDFQNRLIELYVQNLTHMKRGHDWDTQMEQFIKFLRDARHVYSLTRAFGLIPKDGKKTRVVLYQKSELHQTDSC